MKLQIKDIAEKLKKNKYVLLLVAAGLILLLWPARDSDAKSPEADQPEITNTRFSVEETEARLEKLLGKINGAGKVSVMLSVGGSTERVIAENTKLTDDSSDGALEKSEERTAVLTGSGSNESTVELRFIFPEYIGAAVIAEGADSPSVSLSIVRAVSAVTGLASDRISVIKMEKP